CLEVVVEAEAAHDAEAEGAQREGGADLHEDAALGEARVGEAELAADDGVHGDVHARADAEAHAATGVDVDGSGTHVDREVVEGVDAEREAATDVVVAGVDAQREIGGDVLDTEVQSGPRVPDAEAGPVTTLCESGTGTEGGDGDQGNQKLAHANPPNRIL